MSTVIQTGDRVVTPLTDKRPLVSVVLPAFNEAAILERNLGEVYRYLHTLDASYRWEVIIVNDGSSDGTGALADSLRATYSNLTVIHHVTNFGLGQAFKTAFARSRGDYVVTMDVDLSYSPEHIGQLLEKITTTRAKLVLASPYMKGGKLSQVPGLRRFMSVWANRFLSFLSGGQVSTLTCMTRAYDGLFVRDLNLRATGMDVMPETVYKAMVLRARIEQIPAHLDWSRQMATGGPKRRSSMRILRHTLATILQGFVLRPFMFFIVPGLLLMLFAAWTNFWMFMHFFDAYRATDPAVPYRMSVAVAQAYAAHPHTFIIGLLSLMLAIQLVSLGTLALQNKTYFEELFHINSAIKKALSQRGE
jgi:glycosyltransferase involved in cell wall biosynthesis